jgi:hypothetical protein
MGTDTPPSRHSSSLAVIRHCTLPPITEQPMSTPITGQPMSTPITDQPMSTPITDQPMSTPITDQPMSTPCACEDGAGHAPLACPANRSVAVTAAPLPPKSWPKTR